MPVKNSEKQSCNKLILTPYYVACLVGLSFSASSAKLDKLTIFDRQKVKKSEHEQNARDGASMEKSIISAPCCRSPPDNNTNKADACSESFPVKLRRILDDAERNGDDDIISFRISGRHAGRAIDIYKPLRFAEEVMPRYFKTKRYSSFHRQLNIYGFRRTASVAVDTETFIHESFSKDQIDLCKHIKRKRQKIPPRDEETDHLVLIGALAPKQRHSQSVPLVMTENILNRDMMMAGRLVPNGGALQLGMIGNPNLFVAAVMRNQHHLYFGNQRLAALQGLLMEQQQNQRSSLALLLHRYERNERCR